MTVDRAAVEAEVLNFYGPHARRRVFRGGSLRRAFWMQKEEERRPGTHVFEVLDLIEEERLSYRHRAWTVEAVIEAVVRLRELGYRAIMIGRDGRVSVEVGEGELGAREAQRHLPVRLDAAPVRIRDRRLCCNPMTLHSETVDLLPGGAA